MGNITTISYESGKSFDVIDGEYVIGGGGACVKSRCTNSSLLGGEYVVCYSDKPHYYVDVAHSHSRSVGDYGNYRKWIFEDIVRGTWSYKFYRIELYIDKRLDITSCWAYGICDDDNLDTFNDVNPANHLKNRQNTLFIYPHWRGTPRCNISKRLAIGKDFETGKIYIERNGKIRKIKG